MLPTWWSDVCRVRKVERSLFKDGERCLRTIYLDEVLQKKNSEIRLSPDSGKGLDDTTAFVEQCNMLKEKNMFRWKIKEIVLRSLLSDVKNDVAENILVVLLKDLNEIVFQAKFTSQLGDFRDR